MSTRSSWSWVGPLLMAGLILYPTRQFSDGWSEWVSGLAWFAGIVFAAWGIRNLCFQFADDVVDKWRDVMDTLYKNGPAGMAQALQNLNTPQLQLMMRMTAGAWIVKLAPEASVGPDYLLAGTDGVTMEFVKFVLEHSNDEGLYPQNRFNDQAYNWDAVLRLHTDRDMYKELLSWLSRNEMIIWPVGNQPARWKNGWGPELLARRLDLDAFNFEEEKPQPQILVERALEKPVTSPRVAERIQVR